MNFRGFGFALISSSLLLSGCTIGRMLLYNVSDIRDFKKFPERPLPASPAPFKFAESSSSSALGELEVRVSEGKEALGSVLERTNTVAFLVIRHDSLLFEQYFDGYKQDSWVASFSMAKSYISALVGIAIGEGKIKGIEEPITTYLPELKGGDLEDVKIRHLLEMTANIKHAENYFNPFAGVARLYYGKHLPRQLRHLHHADSVGSKFNYQSVATQFLGEIVVRATGKDLSTYMNEKIWGPMGTEYPASWSIDQKKEGREKAFCGINATARDFAKFGRLYLHNGNWQGKQLIPEAWVKASVAVNEQEGSAWFYGYQWWLASRNGDYMAQGHLGQFIYVHPKQDIIIVRLGKNYGKHKWSNTFFDIVTQISQ
jgi:CubicO group peptidase (beta-lactamase class C family)